MIRACRSRFSVFPRLLALSFAIVIAVASESLAEEESPAGAEIRLSGTLGILTNLPGAIEDTSAYQASTLAASDLTIDPPVGFNLEVGWRATERFGVAIHLEHLPDFSVDVETGGRAAPESGSSVLTGESWALTADARVYLLTDQFQPFVVIGAGWLWVATDDEAVSQVGTGIGQTGGPVFEAINTGIGSRDNFVTRGGAGADFYLSDSFFLTTQATYVVPVGGVRDFDYVSIAWGFGYQF